MADTIVRVVDGKTRVIVSGSELLTPLLTAAANSASSAAASAVEAADSAAVIGNLPLGVLQNAYIMFAPFFEQVNTKLRLLGSTAVIITPPVETPEPMLASDGVTYAVLDYAPGLGLYWYNNYLYDNETAFLAAVGATKSGSTVTFGPRLGTTEFITNGTFDTDASGWSGVNATVSQAGGELVVTAAGGAANQFGVQSLSGLESRAFRLTGTVRRGTVSSSVSIRLSTIATLTNANSFASPGNSLTTNVTYSVIGATVTAGTLFAAAGTTGTGAGTIIADDMSLVEVFPFTNFPQADYGIYVRGTMPASLPGATQVIASLDADADTFATRFEARSTGAIGAVVKTSNSTVGALGADIVPGTLSGGAEYRIAARIRANDIAATLNGAPSVTDPNSAIPGHAVLRLGRSKTGENFGGTVERVTIFRGGQPNEFNRHLTAPATGLVVNGDSYAAGAAGAGALTTSIAASTSRVAIGIGVGGSTFNEQKNRLFARPYLRTRTIVWWDGGNAGNTLDGWLADLAEFVAWKGDERWVIIPPVHPDTIRGTSAPSDPQRVMTEQMAAQALALYGSDHIFDATPLLKSHYAGGEIFTDGVHLTTAAMDAVAAAVDDKIPVVEAL